MANFFVYFKYVNRCLYVIPFFPYARLRWSRSDFIFFNRLLSKPICRHLWLVHTFNESNWRLFFFSFSWFSREVLYKLHFFLFSFCKLFCLECFAYHHLHDKKSNLPFLFLTPFGYSSPYPHFSSSSFQNFSDSWVILNNAL